MDTALDLQAGVVSLAWTTASGEDVVAAEPSQPSASREEWPRAGLAFDSVCRLYHAQPRGGTVDRRHWQPLRDPTAGPPPHVNLRSGGIREFERDN